MSNHMSQPEGVQMANPGRRRQYQELARHLRDYGDRRVRIELRSGVFMEVWPADAGDEFSDESARDQIFNAGPTPIEHSSTKLVGQASTLAGVLSGLSYHEHGECEKTVGS